ncbi:MAG: trypsin-like peptidase domain-containing protein [Polyangiales bacterium]
MPRALTLAAAALLAGSSLTLTAPASAQPRRPAPARPAAPARPTTPPPAQVANAVDLSDAMATVAERVTPAVVAIFVEIVERPDAVLQEMQGFWGQAPEEPRRRAGSGSGVILRPDGVIITNSHVVDGATRIRVRLHDGRTFNARTLGIDRATDLAVLRVEATGLPVVRLGDSDAVRAGQIVLAVGAPFGLEATVTHGVVSASGRGGLGVNQIEDYLQTDASINPGNSGGALVNLRGELVGVNTMVVGRGQGIGFAVPSRLVSHVSDQLVATGRVVRGWIGIAAQDISVDIQRAFGPVRSGAVVNALDPEGPAARAGVQLGDVIVAINGRPVHDRHDMVREVASRAVGERLTLTVTRDRQRREFAVTTAMRPGESAAPATPPATPAAEPGPTGFGISIENLPAAYAQRMGLPQGTGVLIAQVQRGGAADRSGLRPGDVVLQADGREARSTDVVVEAARDGRAVLLVRRGRAQEFVGVYTGNEP